jgi:hypothetical protein
MKVMDIASESLLKCKNLTIVSYDKFLLEAGRLTTAVLAGM